MNCAELAERIEKLQPGADTRDVARLCLLLSNGASPVDSLSDDSKLTRAWKEMGLRLQAATDQHAAMTEELERLAKSDPREVHARSDLDSDPRHQSPGPDPAAVHRRRQCRCVSLRRLGHGIQRLRRQGKKNLRT